MDRPSETEWTRLRAGLVRFVRRRHAQDPEELAQEALVRVFANAQGGASIQCLEAYAHGVAERVLLEDHRRQTPRWLPPESALGTLERQRSQEGAFARFEACKRKCLSRQEVRLLEAYYRRVLGDQIQARKALAARCGLTLNALRIQVFHIRRKLRACVEAETRAELTERARSS